MSENFDFTLIGETIFPGQAWDEQIEAAEARCDTFFATGKRQQKQTMADGEFVETNIWHCQTAAELRRVFYSLSEADLAYFKSAILQQQLWIERRAQAQAKFEADRTAAIAAEKQARFESQRRFLAERAKAIAYVPPQPVKVAVPVAVTTKKLPQEVLLQYQNNAHKLCRVHVSRVNALTSLGWQIVQGVSK